MTGLSLSRQMENARPHRPKTRRPHVATEYLELHDLEAAAELTRNLLPRWRRTVCPGLATRLRPSTLA